MRRRLSGCWRDVVTSLLLLCDTPVWWAAARKRCRGNKRRGQWGEGGILNRIRKMAMDNRGRGCSNGVISSILSVGTESKGALR